MASIWPLIMLERWKISKAMDLDKLDWIAGA